MSNLTISTDGKSAAFTVDSTAHRIDYKIINGTAYHLQTSDELVRILELCRDGRTRVEFEYGDDLTGKLWGDIERGTIGRSTGKLQIPLVIKTKRSTAGGALLDHCIVKLTDVKTKAILWIHPLYVLENETPEEERFGESDSPVFDRFDICEAYYLLECDYNTSGWLPERPSNQRRKASTGVQLHRMGFEPRPSLGSFDDLTPNGKAIYVELERRYGFRTEEKALAE